MVVYAACTRSNQGVVSFLRQRLDYVRSRLNLCADISMERLCVGTHEVVAKFVPLCVWTYKPTRRYVRLSPFANTS